MYMTQGLLRASKLQPNMPALVSAKSSFTWSEFKIRVASLAGGLRDLGLKSKIGLRCYLSTHIVMQNFIMGCFGLVVMSCQ